MFTERFLFDTLLKITFSLPLTEIIKHKDMVITIDGLTYEQAQNITSNLKNNLVIVERIIYASAYDNHFIMEDMLPFDFTTENYKISKLVFFILLFYKII